MMVYPKLSITITGAPAEFDAAAFSWSFTLQEIRSLQQAIRRAYPQRDFGNRNYHMHTDAGGVDE